MDKSRILRTVIIPLVVGLLATALVFLYIKSEEKRLSPTDTVPVVVASRPVPAKTVLLPEMMVVKSVPKAYALPNTLLRVEDAAGKVTTVALSEGEPLFLNRVVTKDKAVSLSYYIPQGMRAVTISVNEIIGTAAFPEPGDSVDVLATFSKEIGGRDRTDLILEGLQVLAVVRDTESRGGQYQKDMKSYTSLTLAVTPNQAATLVWAEERGKIRLLLRPANSRGEVGRIEANSQSVLGQWSPAPAVQPQRTR